MPLVASKSVCPPDCGEGGRRRALRATRGKQIGLSARLRRKWQAAGFACHSWQANRFVRQIAAKVAGGGLCVPLVASKSVCPPDCGESGRRRALRATRGKQIGLSARLRRKWQAAGFACHSWQANRFVRQIAAKVAGGGLCVPLVASKSVCPPDCGEGGRRRALRATRGKQIGLSARLRRRWQAAGFACHSWQANRFVRQIAAKVAGGGLCVPLVASKSVCPPDCGEGGRRRALRATRGKQIGLSARLRRRWQAAGFACHSWQANRFVRQIAAKVAGGGLCVPLVASKSVCPPDCGEGGRRRALRATRGKQIGLSARLRRRWQAAGFACLQWVVGSLDRSR